MTVYHPRFFESRVNDSYAGAFSAFAADDFRTVLDQFQTIAAELVTNVRNSVTIDWTMRESARAKIRVMVRRILRKHGYPPDLQAEATKLVLEQAEVLCADWAEM